MVVCYRSPRKQREAIMIISARAMVDRDPHGAGGGGK